MTQHEPGEEDDPVDPVEDFEVEEPEEFDTEDDTEDPEAAPEPSATATPEPPAVLAGVSPMDSALAALSPDLRADTLRRAVEYGVTHADDPLWSMIRAVAESVSASRAAGEAAESARQAIQRLDAAPAAIERAALDGASRAAAEIEQHSASAAEAVVAALTQQIEAASAEPFRKALKPYVRDLGAEAGEVRGAIREGVDYKINQITGDFLKKTQKEIDRRSVATKVAGRMSAILILILGAAIGVAGTKLDHRWSPTPIHSAASGGYSIRVPSGYGGKFRRCGNRECVYLYPPRLHRAGGGK